MADQSRVRSSSVVFPLLLIAFGCLVLLSQRLPDFDPWPVLGRYWPLLLIFIGAGMVWDRAQRSRHPESTSFPIGSTLGTLLFLCTLVFLLWHGAAFASRGLTGASASRSHRQQSVERKDAKAVKMSIKMPAGELIMGGGAEHLMDADFSFGSAWVAPTIDYSVSDGVGNLAITQASGGTLMVKSDNTWNLKVDNNIPIELEVDVGAGRGEFRFARVDLTRLQLNIGAGQADVDLSGERAKDLQAEIQGGVGEAIIRLPKNVGVVADVHGGLGSIDTHGLKKEDGQYVNEAYGKSPATIHLSVNGGIGTIKLQQE